MLGDKRDLPHLIEANGCSLTDGLHAMAVVGLGLAWLPLAIVGNDLQSKKLVRAGGHEHDIALEINLVRRKESLGTNAEMLWSRLQQSLDAQTQASSVIALDSR
jgi:DNA-binding transcriptional LysR family regulator